jgi:hypothetical protein
MTGRGYRRITLELKARGHIVNHKRVSRIMREHQVYSHHRRRFKPVAGSEADVAVSTRTNSTIGSHGKSATGTQSKEAINSHPNIAGIKKLLLWREVRVLRKR